MQGEGAAQRQRWGQRALQWPAPAWRQLAAHLHVHVGGPAAGLPLRRGQQAGQFGQRGLPPEVSINHRPAEVAQLQGHVELPGRRVDAAAFQRENSGAGVVAGAVVVGAHQIPAVDAPRRLGPLQAGPAQAEGEHVVRHHHRPTQPRNSVVHVGRAGAGSPGQIRLETRWQGRHQYFHQGLVAHEAQVHHRAFRVFGVEGMGATHAHAVAVEGGAGAIQQPLAVGKRVAVVHPGHHRLALEQRAGPGAQVAQLAPQLAGHAQYAAAQPGLQPGLAHLHSKRTVQVVILRAEVKVVYLQRVEFQAERGGFARALGPLAAQPPGMAQRIDPLAEIHIRQHGAVHPHLAAPEA